MISCSPAPQKGGFLNNKEEIINNIISYDNNYDYDFLNYIYNNYGINTLENINTSYKDNTYSYNVWHDLTGNSLKVLKDLSNNNLDNT